MSAISCWTRNRLLSVWTSLRRFESEVLVISLRGSCWAMDLPRPKNSLERKITIKLIAETGGGRTSGRNNGPVPWAGELRMPGRAGGGEWRTVVTSWADCVPPPTETIQSYFTSQVEGVQSLNEWWMFSSLSLLLFQSNFDDRKKTVLIELLEIRSFTNVWCVFLEHPSDTYVTLHACHVWVLCCII